MKRVAIISGATGFLGQKVFLGLRSLNLFDEFVLVGQLRHLDALHQLVAGQKGPGVSVIELSRLSGEIEKSFSNAKFSVLMFANSFIRDTTFISFGDYFTKRMLETQSLIEPLIPYKPYVLYPLSWHSWRAIQTPYSATKNGIEQLLLGYEALGKISLGRVALFDTYGPGDSRDKLVPKLLRLDNAEVSGFLSEPCAMINLTHTDDIVKGVRVMAELKVQGLHQLRYPIDIHVWEVAKYLGKWTGATPAELECKAEYLPEIQAEFPPGWKTSIKLEDGLSRLALDSADKFA